MVMAEALACGCPVIASTNTGAANLFAHGEEGFIVPVRDWAAIRDRLTQLADEPDTRRRMSAAAAARIRSLDGWRSYGDAYVDMLVRARTGRPSALAPSPPPRSA
jgi:glycosyltransferase involved in cell wall biosynthesis